MTYLSRGFTIDHLIVAIDKSTRLHLLLLPVLASVLFGAFPVRLLPVCSFVVCVLTMELHSLDSCSQSCSQAACIVSAGSRLLLGQTASRTRSTWSSSHSTRRRSTGLDKSSSSLAVQEGSGQRSSRLFRKDGRKPSSFSTVLLLRRPLSVSVRVSTNAT